VMRDDQQYWSGKISII